MNMIDKVAEAIRDNIAAALPDGVSVDYRYAAVAAIEAMREPTIEMSVEGDEEIISYLNDERLITGAYTPAYDCWTKMIDTALEGGDASDGAAIPLGS